MNTTYNYKEFNPAEYPYTVFQGPKAGEAAIDFELETVQGDQFKLSEHLGKTVVLETGSISCPMYS